MRQIETTEGASKEILGDPRIRGPFPILSTPFLESGEVDYETLAAAAKFVDRCGASGAIWPQSGWDVDFLTPEEKLKGMEVLADATKGLRVALCLGVQGKTTEEALVFARQAAKVECAAIISRPSGDAANDDQLREYWRAIGRTVERPTIIQTAAGKTPPSVELLVELAKEFPHFGYVKEETAPVETRMKRLVAAKPVIKRVFSAMGGFGWLHQFRFGTEGVIAERAVYADVLANVWKRRESGDEVGAANAFSKLLLMLNLRETIPGDAGRGYHLYVWQKRGVFKNRLSRAYNPNAPLDGKPLVFDAPLTRDQTDEIDVRFEALKPFLCEDRPN